MSRGFCSDTAFDKSDPMERGHACWEQWNCTETGCPAHGKRGIRCWLVNDTHCHGASEGHSADKLGLCLQCKVLRQEIDTLLTETGNVLVSDGNELINTFSEIFEILIRLSRGDTSARVTTHSENGLFNIFKILLNNLAGSMQEMVANSHELAIGLCEHYETLNHICTGDFSARSPENSSNELVAQMGMLINKEADTLTEALAQAKAAEESQQTQLNFLSTLLETIPNPIFYKDAACRYLGCNKAFEEYVGFSRSQLTGKTPHQIWLQELADKYLQHDLQLLDNPGLQSYEATVKYADGSLRDVIFNKATFCDRSGAVAGLVGVILDITERKKAEEESRNAYQRLNDIIEFLPDATFVIDNRKRVIAWNKAMEQMTGVTKEQILGQGDLAYSLPFYGIRRNILIDLVDADPQAIDHEYPYIRREGKTVFSESYCANLNRHMWGTATPLFDKDGSRVGSIESIRDITAIKKAEEELKFQNLLLSAQQEISINGILVVDEQARIISRNRRFLEIMNIPRHLWDCTDDTLVLRAATEQVCEPDAFLEKVRYLYAHREEISHDDFALRDGKIVDRYSAPLNDSNGRYYGRVWYFYDVTEQKRTEAERARFEAQRHHSRLMEAFLIQLSHDLRTPITPLFTLLPLIRNKSNEPAIAKMIDICIQSAGSINELTNKALKLVKLSASASGQLEQLVLTTAVDQYISTCTELLEPRRISCENTIDPALVVIAVPEQIRELFENLISNAARYSHQGGVIRISAEKTGDSATVTVHDDGVGIDPAYLESIFDEFFKADESRHDLKSSGLGLSICRRIVSNHNGTIWAESPGKGLGTTIHFTLPLK